MLPLVLCVCSVASGFLGLPPGLRLRDSAKVAEVQVKEAEQIEQVKEEESLEQVHEAEHLEQLKEAEHLEQLHAAEHMEKLHAAAQLAQLHAAEHLEQLKAVEQLQQDKAPTSAPATIATSVAVPRVQQPKPTRGPKTAILPELEAALMEEAAIWTGRPLIAEKDVSEAAVKTEDEVHRLDDVEKTLRKARMESDDVEKELIRSIAREQEADDKILANGAANETVPELEAKAKEVQRLDTAERTVIEARDELSKALNGSEAAKREAVLVAEEVRETQQEIKKVAKNSGQYDFFRAGVSFLLGSVCSKFLPLCFGAGGRKASSRRLDRCETGLDGMAEASII